MSMQREARLLIERLAGIHMLRELPAGIDLAHDIKRWIPGLEVRTILDVGANVGQSARQFIEDYDHAIVHSFEPADTIFRKLKKNTEDCDRIHCHQLAIGRQAEERAFVVKNLVSHIAAPDEDLHGREVQTTHVERLDQFCKRQNIAQINILKIDTEGHDFEVLEGSDELCQRSMIDLVLVESGLYPSNERHVPFRKFQDWFEERGYFLFGFYEQTHEFNGEPQLRRADVAFISPRVRELYRRPPIG